MHQQNEREKLQRLAEQNEYQSWADFGSCSPAHALLTPFIAHYSYSIGCIREQDAKLITRAYPTVMTQLYFEFCGDLSEVKDSRGEFAFGKRTDNNNTVINKRTYIKQGLGSWFDIYQLPSKRDSRPIKNLKVDLYPNTLYQLFRLSPQELVTEDLQLEDLLGVTTSSLMLEEMEAAITGKELVAIVDRYFLNHLLKQGVNHSHSLQAELRFPKLNESLSHQAQSYNKSERWLQKRYAQIYGMSFKQMQSNLKFHQAHQALSGAIKKRQSICLTELAYHSGYFDQAHFIKEFKRFTGMTPGQYLRANVDADSLYLFYW
ncbi:helix-turn-helix domain-containing protein [Amphritea pacifica]|uniref:Helix-turn-helix transcriptional regulator n=1 Tax=Amphritea pacifica TaxID=2811233 RepID=A0ABS2WCX8_9GAMM|nr:helix-turn-helix transcriptional regulator [Amphritea pacifica]MBN0989567.1 helix-turn-helix transcriptional regulator [Amphritea pacifica]